MKKYLLNGEPMTQELLTTDELAERLAVSPRTIITWARRGTIPEIRPSPRVRRFDYADVITHLKDRKDATHESRRS